MCHISELNDACSLAEHRGARLFKHALLFSAIRYVVYKYCFCFQVGKAGVVVEAGECVFTFLDPRQYSHKSVYEPAALHQLV